MGRVRPDHGIAPPSNRGQVLGLPAIVASARRILDIIRHSREVAWDASSNTFAAENNRRRQADVYVFALLAHCTKEHNPLDVSQWDFFLLDTSILNQHARKQRRISLERLVALNALRCAYSELRSLIEGVEARRCADQR